MRSSLQVLDDRVVPKVAQPCSSAQLKLAALRAPIELLSMSPRDINR